MLKDWTLNCGGDAGGDGCTFPGYPMGGGGGSDIGSGTPIDDTNPDSSSFAGNLTPDLQPIQVTPLYPLPPVTVRVDGPSAANGNSISSSDFSAFAGSQGAEAGSESLLADNNLLSQVSDNYAMQPQNHQNEPFVPFASLPGNSQQVLQDRTLDPLTGDVIVGLPDGYELQPSLNGKGLVFAPPGQDLLSPGGNNNIIRVYPDGSGQGMTIRYYNGAGQPISPYTGSPNVSQETSHYPLGGVIFTPR